MTRRVRACLRRLEGRLPVHNGFAPWQQEAYCSVWRDLKLFGPVLAVTPFSRCRTNR